MKILYLIVSLLLSCGLQASDEFENVSTIKAYLYDYTQKKGKELQTSFIIDGKPHTGLIKGYTETLNRKQVQVLKEVVLAKKKVKVAPDCIYQPHHSFVFYDKDGKIQGHIDVCFQCGQADSSFANMPDSRTWDWGNLSKLVKQLGLPILKNSKEYTQLFVKSGQNK